MRKKIKIEAGEGRWNFHNVRDISIIIDDKKIFKFNLDQYYLISKSQAERIDNHFCGMSDCTCGCSAAVEINSDVFGVLKIH